LKTNFYIAIAYIIFDYDSLLGADIIAFCKDIQRRKTNIYLMSDILDGKQVFGGALQSPMLISALVIILRGYRKAHNIKEITIPLIALAITTVSKCANVT
jgi:hypothetical protein